jgi:large subunit ribosomal protein L16
MILIPKKVKYKKQQKGNSFNKLVKTTSLNSLNFGSFGLKSVTHGKLNSKQIESLYNCLNKTLKKQGKIILRIFPHTPVSNKPIEVRMGKGKGNVSYWISKIKAGTILLELETSLPFLAIKALKIIKKKLPFKTKIVYNK